MKQFESENDLTPALTLTLSPGEREQRLDLACLADGSRANSSPRLGARRRTILFPWGEVGVRESVCFFAILLLSVDCALAQYAIDGHTIDGGGGTSMGGVYSVSGTIGQPDAGGPMTNGQYAVTGGFWALPQAVQTEGAPTLAVASGPPGNTTISWTPNTPGFVLQENVNLATTNWVNTASGRNNPANVPTRSYRLSKP